MLVRRMAGDEMAKKRAQEAKKGLDEWMTTYSDMVTLLLCLFVLLYASSNLDESRWQLVYQSFNTSGTYINPFVNDENPNANSSSDDRGNSETPMYEDEDTDTSEPKNGEGGSSDHTTGLPSDYEALFSWIQNTIENSDISSDKVSVEQSANRIYIRFDSTVMFEGNSAVLLDSGKEALKELFPGIRAVREYIKSIKVSGHTAQGFSPINDWDLSSARSSSVIKFMDFNNVVEGEKFVGEAYAQYRPVATNETEEGRSKNRRVEIVIVKNEAKESNTSVMLDILKYDYGINQEVTDPEDRVEIPNTVDHDRIQEIIDNLGNKYQGKDDDDYISYDPDTFVGPAKESLITKIEV